MRGLETGQGLVVAGFVVGAALERLLLGLTAGIDASACAFGPGHAPAAPASPVSDGACPPNDADGGAGGGPTVTRPLGPAAGDGATGGAVNGCVAPATGLMGAVPPPATGATDDRLPGWVPVIAGGSPTGERSQPRSGKLFVPPGADGAGGGVAPPAAPDSTAAVPVGDCPKVVVGCVAVAPSGAAPAGDPGASPPPLRSARSGPMVTDSGHAQGGRETYRGNSHPACSHRAREGGVSPCERGLHAAGSLSECWRMRLSVSRSF